ncbi:hypothetical protein E3W66_04290 [Gammaproteobacteria bacterium LSUCC0057]|uniref:Uncharacterized protein n=1 Tax=Gammaproteobacteria bacterium LSUCC0057 TaxID=2559237 RepID=A0A4Y8UPF2_9GAMM|nr:hypothetical protein E3W66_04290 [Gammaproteobacteria bacterium LSUCC0057]
MAKISAVIGQWYHDVARERLFEVVAFDDYSGAIEVQYEDGTVDEFDSETWRELVLLAAAQPDDWRSSLELSEEDRLFADDVLVPANSGDLLSALEMDDPLEWDEF